MCRVERVDRFQAFDWEPPSRDHDEIETVSEVPQVDVECFNIFGESTDGTRALATGS